MRRRVILLGPPGSGKGTVAARLKNECGFDHFSTGHWLRQEVARGSALGRQAGLFLERGELVPDEVVLALVKDALSNAQPDLGYLSDGFPRTLAQAQAFDAWSSPRGLGIEQVIYFECSEALVLNRITGRRSCGSCGRVYHVTLVPPGQPGRCDDCAGELTQRADDTESVVRKRFKIYLRETEPLIDFYRQQAKLDVVNASQPVDVMMSQTMSLLQR